MSNHLPAQTALGPQLARAACLALLTTQLACQAQRAGQRGSTSPPAGASARGAGQPASAPTAGPYYQIALVWIRDPDTFREYGARVAPVAARYGHIERMLAPSEIFGEGLSAPHMLNVLRYREAAGVAALAQDPQFRAVVPLREASIDLLMVGGRARSASPAAAAAPGRVYLVELAEFGRGGRAAYEHYSERATRAMAPYGYHVERVLEIDDPGELAFAADIARVAYFDSAEGLAAFHADPAHAPLEEAYAAVVRQSLWVTAQVHPESPTASVTGR